MTSLLGILIYLLVVAMAAFALFWVIRLGVRLGLRDHARWVQGEAKPGPQ
jgi:hypothetical protein